MNTVSPKRQLTSLSALLCAAMLLCGTALFAACTTEEDPPVQPSGYKISCLGDSITEGMKVSSTDKRYTSLLAKKPGVASVQNLGVSATTIADCGQEFMNDKTFTKRASKINADADLIFVFGGTNDYGTNFGAPPLGSIEDEGTDTFYGALNVLTEKLQTEHPDAVLLFATPPAARRRMVRRACLHTRQRAGRHHRGHPRGDHRCVRDQRDRIHRPL